MTRTQITFRLSALGLILVSSRVLLMCVCFQMQMSYFFSLKLLGLPRTIQILCSGSRKLPWGLLAQRGVVELFEENVSSSWFNMNWRIWGEEREGVYYLLITALAHSPHMHVEQVIDIQMTLEGMGSRRPFLEWSGERRQWVPGESSGRMHRVWCSSGSQKWRRGQRWLICSQPEILEKVIPLKKNRQNKKKKKFF